MTRIFVELPKFLEKWDEVGLTEDDLRDLENYLCNYPDSGVVIPGTGGLRKLRFSLKNKGKRSGARIIYIDFAVYKKTYLFGVYAKNEKTDLTPNEKEKIKEAIKTLESELKGQ